MTIALPVAHWTVPPRWRPDDRRTPAVVAHHARGVVVQMWLVREGRTVERAQFDRPSMLAFPVGVMGYACPWSLRHGDTLRARALERDTPDGVPQGIRELPPVAIDDERDAMRVAYRPGASLADLADGERTRPLVVEFDGAQVDGATLGRAKHVPHITLRGGTVAQGDSGTIGAFIGQRITLDGMRALGGRQVVSPNFAAAWAVNCAAVGSFNAFRKMDLAAGVSVVGGRSDALSDVRAVIGADVNGIRPEGGAHPDVAQAHSNNADAVLDNWLLCGIRASDARAQFANVRGYGRITCAAWVDIAVDCWRTEGGGGQSHWHVPTDHLLIDRMFMPRSALQFRAAPASMGLVRIRDSVFGGLGAGSLLDHEPRGGRGEFDPAWLDNTRVLSETFA